VPHAFNYRILDQTAHRPWAMPDGPWVMTQTWTDLLFAHWTIDPALLRSKVPDALPLDLFEGRAWIGVVPFRMSNVAPRGVPALPGLSAFPELNVRTYVRVDDKPGVYFFSLDAANPIAVWVARAMAGLPYYSASMEVDAVGDNVRYHSRRIADGRARLDATYRPIGTVFEPTPGTLDYFLTERYCLYTVRGGVRRLDIHHPPWPLQAAEAELSLNTMTQPIDIDLTSSRPLLHFSKRQDTVAWPPRRVSL
jgi:uncharacterized protein